MDRADQNNSEAQPDFILDQFFPYRVRVFYADITRTLSAIYQRDYGLSPAEWRTMAILGGEPCGLQATEIVARCSMDKVVVSRAVKRMQERGFLVRESHKADGRSFLLRLSAKGSAAYRDLVPKMQEAEAKMLQGLDASDLAGMLETMDRIRHNLKDEVPQED